MATAAAALGTLHLVTPVYLLHTHTHVTMATAAAAAAFTQSQV